jgi:hypothetical protein
MLFDLRGSAHKRKYKENYLMSAFSGCGNK